MPKSFKIGPSLSFYGTKCLFKIWANESIQQELLAMGRKQNIWQNIELYFSVEMYKIYARTVKPHKLHTRHETCLKLTPKCNNKYV